MLSTESAERPAGGALETLVMLLTPILTVSLFAPVNSDTEAPLILKLCTTFLTSVTFALLDVIIVVFFAVALPLDVVVFLLLTMVVTEVDGGVVVCALELPAPEPPLPCTAGIEFCTTVTWSVGEKATVGDEE